ncbi:BZ3500_MvSof-1268-A1-R1_Chr2-2g04957 [Microbotryum saponariae]|uniref:BZ3500_MvSof-1268-A1-R1_Chr2-2g04957 protein n=1 Tax=Microbotryum saponariae TaxID=289078 RepID=A0A2X0KN39_9BASI|nr:BZ3500_MvSof-1268-A1-R1_Chr2-2g04957 [Microbotryum saponariae]SDA00563.1 BZ3501_MvSof-1269-A2-R1_Chr2-2g04631 [Microbotryum saponariae]
MEILQAKYLFALTKSQREARRRKAVVCKLVDRLGPRVGRGEKKVVVRAGTGWMDLDAYAMGVLAQAV